MYYDRIYVVPGFGEASALLMPLRKSLTTTARSVEIWKDRVVCRNVTASVSRLRLQLLEDQKAGNTVAVVTHSFGDWVVRQAIAGLQDPPIEALVSIAPLLTTSPIGMMLRWTTGNLFSEVAVMANEAQASLNVAIDDRIRRLLLWAKLDLWVQTARVPISSRCEIRQIFGTHMSIVLQPNVQRLVLEFLRQSTDRLDIKDEFASANKNSFHL